MSAPFAIPVLRRTAVAVAAGLLAVLVAVQPVAAVTWDGESRITSLDVFRPTTLRTGGSSAVVIWQRGSYAYARRTTDGGATWQARTTLASGIGVGVSASASGASVDVVYTKRATSTTTGAVIWRLYYRRSLDGGATWSTPRAMIGSSSSASDQDVARYSNGQVTVAWTSYSTGRIYVRTSTNGGATFGAAVPAARSSDYEPGSQPFYRGNVSVGIGSSGTTYLAYTNARNQISVRRSLNAGSTWSSPTKLTGVASAPEVEILAVGSKAILAYMRTIDGQMQSVYRRTTDRGSSWSSARQTVPLATGQFSLWPRYAYRGGVLGLEVKAGSPGNSPVWYRESTDFGVTWTTKAQVSLVNVEESDPEPGGLAYLDGRILATYFENRGTDNEGMWVRRGTR